MPTVLFTTETASEMGRRGGSASHRPRQRTEPNQTDRFQARRLTRVRRQLTMIDDQLEAELTKPDLDAQLIDRLAAASMRLSDQEFALANRPKPAQAKVNPARTRSTPLPPPTPSQPQAQPVPTTGSVPPQPGQ